MHAIEVKQQGVHLQGVHQVLGITYLKDISSCAEIAHAIMDDASGSKRAAGDEHGGRVDTERGEGASAYPCQRV